MKKKLKVCQLIIINIIDLIELKLFSTHGTYQVVFKDNKDNSYITLEDIDNVNIYIKIKPNNFFILIDKTKDNLLDLEVFMDDSQIDVLLCSLQYHLAIIVTLY